MSAIKHNRKLVIGGAALVKGRPNPSDIAVMAEIRDEVEPLLLDCDFFDKAPFTWISMMLQYGLKNDNVPTYRRIHKKDGDLQLTMELEMATLRKASREDLKRIFKRAVLRALCHVAYKYELPNQSLEHRLASAAPD